MFENMAARGLTFLFAWSLARATWIYFPDSNAVDGCGESCTDNGVFECLGHFTDAQSCEAACIASPSCALFTWSSHTGNCWTRTDNTWELTGAAGTVAGCNDAVIAGCAPWNASNITITVDTSIVLGKTHPLSPAVTLDFWRPDDPRFGVKWANSSAQLIDLADPQLRALASTLAPGLLRLGGSPEDSLIYDSDGTCVPQSGGHGPAPNGYYCSQVSPYSYDCLTPTRWNALLEFASSTGFKVVLGLNGCFGRMSANTSMDMSNVQALLQDTAASPYVSALWGFELSNEVVPDTITPYIWGKDAGTIKSMATSIFSAKGLPVPALAGPDQGVGAGCSPIPQVVAATPPGVLAAVTYHQYPQCTAPAAPDNSVLEVACLQQLDQQASTCVNALPQGKGQAPPVWAGETADHSGGGVANLTDTFRSSFYYAWQLGTLPAMGVELAARQCLSGGDYELLQRGSFEPNPDFFIIWLFKALIGGGASSYNVTHSVSYHVSGLRVFAFSASAESKGSVTLLVVNLGTVSQALNLTLAGPGIASKQRVEYHLTGDPTIPHGTVSCNGIPLVLDPTSHLPPVWSSLGQPASGAMVVQPASIVFATLM